MIFDRRETMSIGSKINDQDSRNSLCVPTLSAETTFPNVLPGKSNAESEFVKEIL